MSRYEEFIAPPQWSELFDLFRMRLENEVPRPAILGMMAATSGDGKDVAARGLAAALANAGYRTLLVDAASVLEPAVTGMLNADINELVRRMMPPSRAGLVAVLPLGESEIQLRTSQRDMQAAFAVLNAKFDYVIVNTPAGRTTALSAAVSAVANAIVVTVKKGRRQLQVDAQLATSLKRLGSRFLGVLALDPELAAIAPNSLAAAHIAPLPRREPAHVKEEYAVREVVERPT